MRSKPSLPPEALEKLKAVRELTLRGVGGEKENARKILRRKLAEHGLTETAFDHDLGPGAATTPPPEPLPASLRTIYISEDVTVHLVAGTASHLVRDANCGVVVRNGTLTLCGTGTVTVTLAASFRTLYASGSGAITVTGFAFKDVGLYHSGTGTLTVAGEALHATLAPSGPVTLNALRFMVRSLKITATGNASVQATCRTACITAAGRSTVRVTARQSAAVTAEPGAKVTVLDCPLPGRRPSGPGTIRWQ